MREMKAIELHLEHHLHLLPYIFEYSDYTCKLITNLLEQIRTSAWPIAESGCPWRQHLCDRHPFHAFFSITNECRNVAVVSTRGCQIRRVGTRGKASLSSPLNCMIHHLSKASRINLLLQQLWHPCAPTPVAWPCVALAFTLRREAIPVPTQDLFHFIPRVAAVMRRVVAVGLGLAMVKSIHALLGRWGAFCVENLLVQLADTNARGQVVLARPATTNGFVPATLDPHCLARVAALSLRLHRWV